MKTLPFALLTLLCAAAPTLAAPTDDHQTFASGNAPVALLELYTSEGCSSCPPAEAWLSRLTTQPKLWEEIVPVAFHVDYWDNLGWSDRFASSAATTRQRAYAAAWGSDSVYTPGFVLNGREWAHWSATAAGTLPPATTRPGSGGKLRAVADGRTVAVSFHPAGRPDAPREVTVALLGFQLHSNVRAGENQGRSLDHDFVVLAAETKKLSSGGTEEHATFEMPAVRPAAPRVGLAVWVQDAGNGSVEQATGGWLSAAVPAGGGR